MILPIASELELAHFEGLRSSESLSLTLSFEYERLSVEGHSRPDILSVEGLIVPGEERKDTDREEIVV